MKKLPIVALIGQTNAGKSSLLNRMARKNIAIVAREEGTTRDNVMATIDDAFILVDTAGLKDPTDDFEASIQDQIQDAIGAADVILVALDSTKYFDHRDKKIAKDALKSGKPVFLVLNKCDLGESLPIEEFRALGIAPENIFYTSATTGVGIKELKAGVLADISRSGARPAVRKPRAAGANTRAAALRTPLRQDENATTDTLTSLRIPLGEVVTSREKNTIIRNKTIKKVTTDIYKCQFNTAVAGLMEYVNELYKVGVTEEDLVVLAKLLKPFAPHLASEMLEKLGTDDEWPKWDEKYLVQDVVEVVVQINGKLRAKLNMSVDEATDEEKVKELALADERVQKYVESGVKKAIFVPKAKLLNLVV